jgi:hypothetical protein
MVRQHVGMLTLQRLRTLHTHMQAAGESRRRFVWETGRHGRRFSVVFLADHRPMVLLFGLVGGQFAFELDVRADYSIDTYLGDQLGSFKEALGLTYRDGEPFSTSAIFRDFADVIPTDVAQTDPVTHRDIPRTREVEEADKVFFIGWRHHGTQSHVSAANLEKTRLYLGEQAYQRCRHDNISSCWTDELARDRQYFAPGR